MGEIGGEVSGYRFGGNMVNKGKQTECYIKP